MLQNAAGWIIKRKILHIYEINSALVCAVIGPDVDFVLVQMGVLSGCFSIPTICGSFFNLGNKSQ